MKSQPYSYLQQHNAPVHVTLHHKMSNKSPTMEIEILSYNYSLFYSGHTSNLRRICMQEQPTLIDVQYWPANIKVVSLE